MVSLRRCGNCGHFVVKYKNEWLHWVKDEHPVKECISDGCVCNKPSLEDNGRG